MSDSDLESSRRRALPPESRVRTDSTGIVNKRVLLKSAKKQVSWAGWSEKQEEPIETLQPAKITDRRPTILDATVYSRGELLAIRQEGQPLAEKSLLKHLAALHLSRPTKKEIAARPRIVLKNKKQPVVEVSESPSVESEDGRFLLPLFEPDKPSKVSADKCKSRKGNRHRHVHWFVKSKVADGEFTWRGQQEHVDLATLVNDE